MSDKANPVDIRFTSIVSTDDDEDQELEHQPPIAGDATSSTSGIPESGTTDSQGPESPNLAGADQRDGNQQVESPITRTHPFRPQIRPAAAHLRIYHDDQRSYETVSLRSDRTVIGRTSGDILIDHDSQISSEHVEIIRKQNEGVWEWHLRDLNSTNGTYISVERARLHNGDELLMGSNRYQFHLSGRDASLEHLAANGPCQTIDLQREGTLVGRDKSDQMASFHDRYLDPKHALISMGRDEQWFIANTKSLNGVWYRVRELRLFRACYFQIGEQRFGFRS